MLRHQRRSKSTSTTPSTPTRSFSAISKPNTANQASKTVVSKSSRQSSFTRQSASTVPKPSRPVDHRGPQTNQTSPHPGSINNPNDPVFKAPGAGKSLANRIRQNTFNPNSASLKVSDLNETEHHVVPPPPKYDAEVPKLVSGLRGVLAQEGPVSVGKFDTTTPYLDPQSIEKNIPQPKDINWEAIPPFITSSRDPALLQLAKTHSACFMGSTSSVSPLLSQLHFAITDRAPINITQLSHWFQNAATNHTRASLKPSISLLRRRDESIWGVDNPPSGDPKSNQILIDLGKSLERHLTYEWDDFNRIFVRHYDETGNLKPNHYSAEEVQESEAHAFLRNGSFLLRSQLDCEDQNVPTDRKVFDLKTRATLPIRLDVMNHSQYLDYKITTKEGLYNSFEREFYDMGRSAFLKYSFQCRIGNMGGVFVAYHNTAELFGFEYIPTQRMDQMVYGSSVKANFVFRHSLNLMEEICARLTKDLADPARPERDTIRLTSEGSNGRLTIFAEKFPHVDLDDPVALDKALSCPHRGLVYMDWLNEDQARRALARRGLSTVGPRSHLISRLESHCLVPSVLYQPPTEDDLAQWFEEGSVKVYNLHVNLFHELSQSFVPWDQFDDVSIQQSKVKFAMREVDQSKHRPELVKRFHAMLNESALIDRNPVPIDYQLPSDLEEEVIQKFIQNRAAENVDVDGNPIDEIDTLVDTQDEHFQRALAAAKRTYLEEIVDHIDIAGCKVPVSRADLIRFDNKKAMMSHLVDQYTQYSGFDEMAEGSGKQLLQEQLKNQGFLPTKAVLQLNKQKLAKEIAAAAGRGDEPVQHRRSE